jgi:molybdopterin-guanine dinucleotide biosynthesis protein A
MLSIVIQAGGESRRMGQDKALLPFMGRPLIERVLQRVAPIADEVLITTNRPDAYAYLGVRLASDVLPSRGALGGLFTALSFASQPLAAVIACDMPFINPDLLAAERHLLEMSGADVVVPRTDSGLEPFHAVYRRQNCLPHIQAALEADKWRVDSWYSQVKVHIMHTEEILSHDPRQLSFWNVNTPEELEVATRLAQELNDI